MLDQEPAQLQSDFSLTCILIPRSKTRFNYTVVFTGGRGKGLNLPFWGTRHNSCRDLAIPLCAVGPPDSQHPRASAALLTAPPCTEAAVREKALNF